MSRKEDPYSMEYDSDYKHEPRHDGIMIQEAWWAEPREMRRGEFPQLVPVPVLIKPKAKHLKAKERR